jgi:hypothetical protein
VRTRLLVAGAALAVAGIWAARDGADAPPVRAPAAPLADCSTGPWADHCPEAGWAREVATAAGFRLAGDNGVALTIERSGRALHLWAFTPEDGGPRQPVLRKESYRRERTVDDVAVFGDGQRVTWEVYGLWVWMADAGPGGLDSRAPGVADVVRASAEVPWP